MQTNNVRPRIIIIILNRYGKYKKYSETDFIENQYSTLFGIDWRTKIIDYLIIIDIGWSVWLRNSEYHRRYYDSIE